MGMFSETPWEILSFILMASLSLAWFVLIFREKHALGPMASLHDPKWFKDIFRQGLEIMRRSPWLLIILLLGTVVANFDGWLRGLIYFERHSEDLGHRTYPPESLLGFVSDLGRDFIPTFIRAISQLEYALLVPFRSPFIIAAFLLLVMIVFLKSRTNDIQCNTAVLSKNARISLGVLSGATGFYFLVSSIWSMTRKIQNYSFWRLIPGPISSLLCRSFAYALLIPLLDAADQEEDVSVAAGFSEMERYFPSMFFFSLVKAIVGLITALSVYVGFALTRRGVRVGTIGQINEYIYFFLMGMIAFVPVIIVIRQKSITSAFKDCIAMWAKHAKDMAAFVVVSALLLLIPELLQGRLHQIFPSYLSWERQVIHCLLSLYGVSAGVLVISSMVVFCRKVLEEKCPPLEATSGENEIDGEPIG